MSETLTITPATAKAETTLLELLTEIEDTVPPLWPLADYVAVNPFVGLTGQTFLEARQLLSQVRDCDLLMPREHFQSQWHQGHITLADVRDAPARCIAEHPEYFAGLELHEVLEWLNQPTDDHQSTEPRFRTVSETVDLRQHTTWTSHIINDISRHCSAHFDEGQAPWANPWKGESLYEGWRNASRLGRRMDMLGLTGFRSFAARLPARPQAAILQMLNTLEIPQSCWKLFLLCELFSIAGWASFVKYRVREDAAAGIGNDDLIGLLAMRLAYDIAIAQAPGIPWPLPLWPADILIADGEAVPPTPAAEVLNRYVMQVAGELAYQRQVCRKLTLRPATATNSRRKTLQMVFCIDVRSEVFRRHLESVSDGVETFGFAGFFGMPVEYVPLGETAGTAQCPVLLQPSFCVHEAVLGDDAHAQSRVCRDRRAVRQGRKLWKSFQTSAASCFSFVEAIGLTYFAKLLADSLRLTRPVAAADHDGLQGDSRGNLGPDLHAPENTGLSPERQVELAEGTLRNLGLTTGFARVVALCGHAADVVNNPLKASLDCGACGGHSGAPNARIAAALLNDPQVRAGLSRRGIEIPADTWFAAALHNTTTDEIVFCDPQMIPASHADDFAQINSWLQAAGKLTRVERSHRFANGRPEDLLRRSRDWSEVRPEWGLAGNAAFIIAPRTRTLGLDFGGRTFLHSYDHQRDPELKVLELIMTAPLVVTNWINLQYYASTVDPLAFGSGSKVIHNVVGQIGVFQGNGGDLMTGLPWQSVHDGKQFQHEPLRLLVAIEAPRAAAEKIILRHQLVRDLVSNGWLSLIVMEGDRFYRWSSNAAWEHEVVA
ncbi:YbcC family protein [Planctomicrobium piriforme]|uniref:Probable inorganic carbon transporter subunit DabA n=1 Tax=Planctomicrobium piriforme TaxID=1576369 RepID=A0A1I3SH97_9PLAN|nr:DUF2309 domain-containing protein [Planctomicrobium piriforme]SFJ57452.1 hypothetical protein SAMN05421753_12414 [Planctomicrobium piriforme]